MACDMSAPCKFQSLDHVDENADTCTHWFCGSFGRGSHTTPGEHSQSPLTLSLMALCKMLGEVMKTTIPTSPSSSQRHVHLLALCQALGAVMKLSPENADTRTCWLFGICLGQKTRPPKPQCPAVVEVIVMTLPGCNHGHGYSLALWQMLGAAMDSMNLMSHTLWLPVVVPTVIQDWVW